MSASFDARPGSHGRGRGVPPPNSWDDPEWARHEGAERDWKKLLLVIGLGILSWVATYVGMLELIEANMGDLPLVHKAIIGFSVAMLMVMVVWLLDQIFSPIGFGVKAIYAAGYLFLTVISVGFGFGFYWKVLESRGESSRSAESAISQVQNSLYAASTRLEQLQTTLESLTLLSTQKSEFERANGTSCPASKPGDGPRRKLREDDAQRFTFASDFVKGRVGAVKGEMKALDADLQRIIRDDKSIVDGRTGTRNEFLRQVGRKLDLTVTGFNAFRTDPQLRQIRSDLAERAERTTFPDSRGGTFSCPDGQLQAALRGVVRAIDQLPEIEKPKISVVEGSEAVIEAFRRLTATFYGALAFRMPPSPEELRELQKKAVAMAEGGQTVARAPVADQAGLSKRDYIPLAIAIFVDLCLLLVSMGRPVNRLGGLVSKMRAAERGPVFQILSRFKEIHHDEETREKFEIFRHVVFDYLNDYYVAVPLDAPKVRRVWIEVPRDKVRTGLDERLIAIPPADRAELQREAHLLANLFASFEQEKIFFRIDDRWLARLFLQVPNVEAARRKLRRQGSKFSEADAFRIYKFSDGAWSEIILGAIMGAARRAENERGTSGPAASASREPTLDADAIPTVRPLPATSVFRDLERMTGERLDRPTSEAPRSHGLPPRQPELPRAVPTYGNSAEAQAQFGAYARFLGPVTDAGAPTWKRGSIDDVLPAALARPADRSEAPAARPANNNTAPSARLDYRPGDEAPVVSASIDVPVREARREPVLDVPASIDMASEVAAEPPTRRATSLVARLDADQAPEPTAIEDEAPATADDDNLGALARLITAAEAASGEAPATDAEGAGAADEGVADGIAEPVVAASSAPVTDAAVVAGAAAVAAGTDNDDRVVEIDVDRITRWYRARAVSA